MELKGGKKRLVNPEDEEGNYPLTFYTFRC